jgi:hypothetical protein
VRWTPYDDNGEPIAFAAVPPGQSVLFQPVDRDGDWRLNAIVDRFHKDDGVLGFGYADAGRTLVEKWVTERSANDSHLMPIIWLYRHALELDLKACIRVAARCLAKEAKAGPSETPAALGEWLRRTASHQLRLLAQRLDSYLVQLDTEPLPLEVRAVLEELHDLDPGGDNFRYATRYDRTSNSEVKAKRPASYHVDISRLGGILEQTHGFLSGAVYTWLDDALQTLTDMENEYDPNP